MKADQVQFEKTMRQWCPDHWTFESDGVGGYHNLATEYAWIAWQGATGTERERCAARLDVAAAEYMASATENKFLTDAGREQMTSAAGWAENMAHVLRDA